MRAITRKEVEDMGTLLAIGEALIDFIPEQTGCAFDEVRSFSPMVGGAPANVCAAFAKLGGSSRFLTKLGDDPFGDKIVKELDGAGVDTSYIIRTSEANTALAFVSLGKDGDRTFSFYRNPSADMLLNADEIGDVVPDDLFALHFCSVSLGDFPMKEAHRKVIDLAKKKGAVISFDPNLRFNLWKDEEGLRRVVREFIPMCDLIKISDEELEFITGKKDVESAAEMLFDEGVKLVAYTRGKDGALLMTKHARGEDNGVPVKAIDTTGAGDAFAGALLWHLNKTCKGPEDLNRLTGEQLNKAVLFADRYCAVSITRNGAIPSYPTIEELFEYGGVS